MVPFPTNVRDPNYVRDLNLWSAQQGQDAANQKTLTEWQQTASNWQLAAQQRIDYGKQTVAEALGAAPALPVQTIYNDDGSVAHPPFPGVTLPPIHDASSHSTPIVATGSAVPLDRTDALLIMMQQLMKDVEYIKSKV